MPTVLLTRTQADNQEWAELLSAQGIDSISSPLITIETLSLPIHRDDYDGVIITSKHALHALSAYKELPLFIVGEHTAKLTEAKNIQLVAASAENLLSGLAARQFSRPLLYLSGETITLDLAQALAEYQITVQRKIVYRAISAQTLSPEALFALEQCRLDGIALFSSRTAEIAHDLIAPAVRRNLHAFCFSGNIGRICKNMGDWKAIHSAKHPSRETFLELLHNVLL